MEKKNNKGLVWMIIILSVIIICLISFIYYKEFNHNQSEYTKNDNTISKIEDFPQKNDNTVLASFYLEELLYDNEGNALFPKEEEFQNIPATTKDNIKYNMTCIPYTSEEQDNINDQQKCEGIKIHFDDYNTDIYSFFGFLGQEVIITEKYIIKQTISGNGKGSESIMVENKEGNIVFTANYTTYLYSVDGNFKEAEKAKIVVVNNKLYYVSYTDDSIKSNQLYLNSLDLFNLEQKRLQTFEGIPWGLE